MTLKECFIHAQNTQDPLDSSEPMLSVMWRSSRGLATLCATPRCEAELNYLQLIQRPASGKPAGHSKLIPADLEADDWVHTLVETKHLKPFTSYAGTFIDGIPRCLWRVAFRKSWKRKVKRLCKGRRLLPYARKDAAKQVFEKA